MSTGPYDLAIKISAVDAVSPVLRDIARLCGVLTGNFDKLSKSMKMAIGGAVVADSGKGVLEFLGKAIEKGNEYVNVQNKMVQAGVSLAKVNEASSKAWALTQQNMNVGVVDILKASDHLRQVFGTQEEANKFIGPATSFMSFDKAWGAGGGKNADPERETLAAIKIAEQEGNVTPEHVKHVMDLIMKAKVASGGNITAQDMLTTRNLAGAAWNTMADDYKYGVMPALMQTQKTNAGVQAMTAFQKLSAGQFWTKTNITAGVDSGLIDPNLVEYDKTGRPMRLNPGALKYGSEFAGDPLRAYEQHLKPYMDAHFGDDKIGRAQFLGQLGGNRNVIRQENEFDQQWKKLEKDRILPSMVKDDMKSFVDNSLYAQMDAFKEQWKNLMTALGAPAVRDATAALKSINEAIASWGGWMSQHPGEAKFFVEVAAGVSALAVAVGALGIAAAAARVTTWGLTGNVGGGVGAAAAGTSGTLPLLAAGLGAYLGADYLKKGFDYGADKLTGVNPDDRKDIRDRGIGFYFNDLTEEIRKWRAPGLPSTLVPQPGAPGVQGALMPPPSQPVNVQISTSTQLDSRTLAKATVSQMTNAATFPTSASGTDTRAQWVGPSAYPTEQ